MAADQERADRIRALKADRPDLKWQYIADRVGVTMRAAQSWQEKGEISYANAKKLADLLEIDVDYIWRGDTATPDPFNGTIDSRLDRIEAALEARVDHDKRVAGLIEDQNRLLKEQSELLKTIRALITSLGMPEGSTIQEHLVGLLRDTAARAAGPSGPTESS